MAWQSQSNALIAYKVQSGLGSQASGSGGTVLRTSGGQGGRLTKAAIESNEVRSDGMRSRGRHGSQKTSGAYEAELSVGAMDQIFEAVMRGTWGSADLTLDEGDFTSLTTGANTIVLGSGSPISLGLRIGNVIRLGNHASAGNNDRNLRITDLDATTITVAETLTVNGVADTDCEIVRPGRVLINPATLVPRYFTVEEYEVDIDASEVFTDCVWSSIRFSMSPDGLMMASPGWTGTGQFENLSAGSAPLLTSPTLPTGVPMAVVDATLRLGSTDMVDLTGFDLTLDIGAMAPTVLGPSKYGPDVFTGQMAISGSISALRQDLSQVAAFIDETVLSLHLLAVDNAAEPKPFFSLMVPNFTLGAVDKSALSKQGGPRTQQLGIPQQLVGKDERGSEYDATMVQLQVSNAS